MRVERAAWKNCTTSWKSGPSSASRSWSPLPRRAERRPSERSKGTLRSTPGVPCRPASLKMPRAGYRSLRRPGRGGVDAVKEALDGAERGGHGKVVQEKEALRGACEVEARQEGRVVQGDESRQILIRLNWTCLLAGGRESRIGQCWTRRRIRRRLGWHGGGAKGPRIVAKQRQERTRAAHGNCGPPLGEPYERRDRSSGRQGGRGSYG